MSSSAPPPARPAMPPRPGAPVAQASNTPPRATVPANAPPGATVPAAATERKKREFKVLPAFYGLLAWNADNTPVMDEKTVDGVTTQVQRSIKLEAPPELVTIDADGNPVADAPGFNVKAHARLKPSNFKKQGDFYRHQAMISERAMQDALRKASLADAGKLKTRAGGKKVQEQLGQVLDLLRATLDPAQLRATLEAKGLLHLLGE